MLHSGHYINAGFVSWPQSVYLSIFYGISYALQASGHLLYLQCFEMHAMQHTRRILLSITATKLLAAELMPKFDQHSQSKSHMPSQTTNLDLWKLQPHLLPAAFGKPGIMRVAYHCHFVTCAPTCTNTCLRVKNRKPRHWKARVQLRCPRQH